MTLDDRVKAVVTKMLERGVPSIINVHNILVNEYGYGQSYKQFYRDFKKEDFKTREGFEKRGNKPKKQEYRDELILHDPPLTLDNIAEKESEETGRKLTCEGIRQYMICKGQYTEWKKRRAEHVTRQKHEKNEKKDQKNERRYAQQELLDVIRTYYVQRALQEDKPKGCVAEYYYSVQRKETNISLNRLEGFFEDYFAAQEGNVKKSLKELGEKHSITLTTASHILSKVGLEPLYGSLDRKVTPKYKKAALKRATALEMSTVDVAYFLNVETYNAYNNMRIYGKAKRTSVILAQFVNGKDKEYLFYKHASQVYEAQECGFTPEETQQLVDISSKAYNFIMQNRTTIEPVIINALRTMYATPMHSLPYVTAELKKNL